MARGWRPLQTKLTWFVMALWRWRARARPPSWEGGVLEMFALRRFPPLAPIQKALPAPPISLPLKLTFRRLAYESDTALHVGCQRIPARKQIGRPLQCRAHGR
jgi:hypothetical protein